MYFAVLALLERSRPRTRAELQAQRPVVGDVLVRAITGDQEAIRRDWTLGSRPGDRQP